ncbi:MAG TPA: hypothetical protein VHB25_10590 [Gemmatimonadaceae bacterium]|nr:hypothetical protein [Gemmatimonadaceae bacterium]
MSENRRRSIRGLVASWVVYWAGLAAVKLGPLALAIWRATHNAPGTSSVNGSISDFLVSVTVVSNAKTMYSASAHLLTIAAWIAVPPLAAWAVWIMARPTGTRLGVSPSIGAQSPEPQQLSSGNAYDNYRTAPDKADAFVSKVTKRS